MRSVSLTSERVIKETSVKRRTAIKELESESGTIESRWPTRFEAVRVPSGMAALMGSWAKI